MKHGFKPHSMPIQAKGWGAPFAGLQPPSKDVQPRKIKILRLIARLNIGGPAIHVQILTRGLDPERFDTTLVAGIISRQEGDMGYLFDRLEQKPIFIPEMQREIQLLRDMKSFFHVLRIINRHKPDIIHTHTAKAGTQARLGALIYKLISARRVKTVHTFHGHVFEGYFPKARTRLYIFIERLLARATDVIIAISNSQKQELAVKYRIAPPRKIRTIRLGFDLAPFLASRERAGHFRRQLGVNSHTLLIGIIGRLVKIKNHRLFLQAARSFIDTRPDIPCLFAIIGDGELKEELAAFCRQLGIERRVVFCGWKKEVATVYADLDILALTSQNEGTPVSIIEAMAAAVPVVATDAGGVRDLLGPRDTLLHQAGVWECKRGILCRRNIPEAFAQGLCHMASLNPTQREQVIGQARSYVVRQYNNRRLFRDMESLYLELTGRHAA